MGRFKEELVGHNSLKTLTELEKMFMDKTDITVRTEEYKEGVQCEVFFKFVEGSLEGARSKTLEGSLYPGRQLLQESQHRDERNCLKDAMIVHRPRISFVSVQVTHRQ
ncbi:hypothetical protein FNV43_RR13046 [Rhamnella rubrinervis]|uniref:Uncharacterized protein n=1 Tax=Rhamnella rubrinervis TaxID=2594499 RepID=A0A8K0H0E6_9ROSA|nr:hypothetical protein FNV43_RR13046 [Rhamnella rubrinervis]